MSQPSAEPPVHPPAHQPIPAPAPMPKIEQPHYPDPNVVPDVPAPGQPEQLDPSMPHPAPAQPAIRKTITE